MQGSAQRENPLYQMPYQRPLGPSIYVFHRFFYECCHAIILIFLLSNFTLNLRNPAATRGVSPSIIGGWVYIVCDVTWKSAFAPLDGITM